MHRDADLPLIVTPIVTDRHASSRPGGGSRSSPRWSRQRPPGFRKGGFDVFQSEWIYDSVLHFGKHRGCRIDDPQVPTSYLEWLLQEADIVERDGTLRAAIEEEVRRQSLARQQRQNSKPEPASSADANAIGAAIKAN